jgi:hypothetical protein
VLGHLALVGFEFAPTSLGFDEQGREVLSFIEGESGRDAFRCIVADEGLAAFAALLRRYHDAIAGYRPPPGTEWAYGVIPMDRTDIICHGDFGPWNLVWRGTRPVAILDWDLAYPGPALDDVAYALAWSAPFRDDAHAMGWHGFTSPPARRHRIEVFAASYGTDSAGLVDAVIERQWKYDRHIRYLHDRGLVAPWTTTASLQQNAELARWSEVNRHLFA